MNYNLTKLEQDAIDEFVREHGKWEKDSILENIAVAIIENQDKRIFKKGVHIKKPENSSGDYELTKRGGFIAERMMALTCAKFSISEKDAKDYLFDAWADLD